MKRKMAMIGLCLAATALQAAIEPVSPLDGQTVAIVPDAQKQVMNVPTLEGRMKLLREDRRHGKKLKHDKYWRHACPLVLELRTTGWRNTATQARLGMSELSFT